MGRPLSAPFFFASAFHCSNNKGSAKSKIVPWLPRALANLLQSTIVDRNATNDEASSRHGNLGLQGSWRLRLGEGGSAKLHFLARNLEGFRNKMPGFANGMVGASARISDLRWFPIRIVDGPTGARQPDHTAATHAQLY